MVEQFYRGWVMDEMIGMILNPRGLARILKAGAVGVGTKLDISGLA